MTIKANGRSALILAAGLFVCFAGPSQAEGGADNMTAGSQQENAAGAPIALTKYTKPGAHHARHHKSSKVAVEKGATEKASTDKKADNVTADADNSSGPSTITPSVANANAQLPTTDSPTAASAKAMSARANDIVQSAQNNPADTQPTQPAGEPQVVSADQFNDLDRALHEAPRPAPTLALASAEAPAAPAPPAAAANSDDSSTWDQTSLIGKIFIGFGALLTMASAARMFMA